MLNTLLPILLFAALGLAVLGALRRVRMWRRGRPSKVNLIGGLLAMPRRYLVDLHHVVERDKYMSKTHVATAGGFVLAALLGAVAGGAQPVYAIDPSPEKRALALELGRTFFEVPEPILAAAQ